MTETQIIKEYDFATIERKWQRYWEQHKTFETTEDPGKPKLYVLDMFPYPSGAGLHVGHPEGYTATDIVSRYKRMKGFNVLHPMGYDAFGLPAQQYAVETGVHPRVSTERNINNIQRQIKALGFSYDWSRRIATTDVEYYKWTQWIFLQIFNSWFDPVAQAARPIRELQHKLETGQYLVDGQGQVIPNPARDGGASAGASSGTVRWHEMSAEQRREIIDAHRLAYVAEVPVNWCPALGTVLANEEVTNEGLSERGNHPVYRRPLKQWMLRITKYAERLLSELEDLDWPESIKLMQRNWIGRSEGAEVDFPVEGRQEVIRVYTTRPDTLYGATYMVLAPEHPLVAELTADDCRDQVKAYVEAAANKSELERVAQTREKTGVFIGAYAINPVFPREHPSARIPIWIADYVMMGYGTGAIMAVPAHDTRDFEFATKYELPIVQVVEPPEGIDWRGYVDDGIAVNSPPPGVDGQVCDFNGLPTPQAKAKITAWLEEKGLGRGTVNYRLRDWVFSRQWYWGEPFPIVYDEAGQAWPLDESQLPVELPQMDSFTPSASDDPQAPPEPPLGRLKEWVNVRGRITEVGTVVLDPNGPRSFRRETNTMPQWAGSCWYYLRYLDPHNDRRPWDADKERYWMPVDLYVGGAEHAVLHLLYARFWHKILYDLGYVSTREPFRKLFNQGMIRSFAYTDSRGAYVGYDQIDFRDDGPYHKQTGEKLNETIEKMSKSLKNVINPDEVVVEHGADTLRLYEMAMGPLEASKPWNPRDVAGVHRFLNRVWRMIIDTDTGKLNAEVRNVEADEESLTILHKTIKKVEQDIERFAFHTAISQMMIFVNEMFNKPVRPKAVMEQFVLILSPFAPHIAEELWQRLGHDNTLAYEPWPRYREELTQEKVIELPIQVNGKLRSRIRLAADADEPTIREQALANDRIQQIIAGKQIVRVIVIPSRLVNIVVR